jgi:RecA/RadA recombinase
MKCNVFLKSPHFWLDTGSPSANATLGSRKYGLPTGRMWEIAGPKHAGKSAETMWLGGLAQRQHNAFVLWIDAEGSLQNESDIPGKFRNRWASRLGLNLSADSFYCIYPKILKSKVNRKKGKKITKKGGTIIESAEFLLKEAEEAAHIIKEREPERPLFIAIDSVANLQTEMAMDAGFADRNMRVALDRAQFLSYALPRLVTLAVNYSAWVFLINQLRTNSMKLFGDNRYSPGGAAKEHNCHVQVWMTRREKESEESEGDLISISGKMVNIKNKAGGNSLQSQKCSYSIRFNKKPEHVCRFGPLLK